MKRLLKSEVGMTLVELLIAMVVTAIGISALVAGFSSGLVSVNRARVTTTAGTLADKQMESYRQGSFAALSQKAPVEYPTMPTGYWMKSEINWCSASTGPVESCSNIPASRPVLLVTITVRAGSDSAPVLFTESSTFDSSTG